MKHITELVKFIESQHRRYKNMTIRDLESIRDNSCERVTILQMEIAFLMDLIIAKENEENVLDKYHFN